MAERKFNLLMIGDAEAGAFQKYKNIAADYGFSLEVVNGLNWTLQDILNEIPNAVKDYHDIVLCYGLTFGAWDLTPAEILPNNPKLLLPEPSFNLETIPEIMTQIVNCCQNINNDIRVFLVLPNVKDMFNFNFCYLLNGDRKMGNLLFNHPQYRRSVINDHARNVFDKLLSLLDPEYNWPDKKCLVCQRVLEHLHSDNNYPPHVRYLGKLTDKLYTRSLIDGFFPSDVYASIFFQLFSDEIKGLVEPFKYVYNSPVLPPENSGKSSGPTMKHRKHQHSSYGPRANKKMKFVGPVLQPENSGESSGSTMDRSQYSSYGPQGNERMKFIGFQMNVTPHQAPGSAEITTHGHYGDEGHGFEAGSSANRPKYRLLEKQKRKRILKNRREYFNRKQSLSGQIGKINPNAGTIISKKNFVDFNNLLFSLERTSMSHK